MNTFANPIRSHEVNVAIEPADLLPIVRQRGHAKVNHILFEPQFIFGAERDVFVLNPDLNTALGQAVIQTGISKG